MQIKNVTATDVAEAIAIVNVQYDGNIELHSDADTRWSVKGVPTFQGRIWVKASKGTGAAVSYNGRSKKAACWHVFRDVFAQILNTHPEAVIKTLYATYTHETFSDVYPATGRVNVGSMVEPLDAEDACRCEDHGLVITLNAKGANTYDIAAGTQQAIDADSVLVGSLW